MTPEHRQAQRFLALDPARSVVVEACAGSGKTWLLSSRLLRLLLAGARPGEILAITYTRKAAREIEARLRSLLGELARASEGEALKLLCARGLSEGEARAALPRAQSLFEAVLAAEPAITITTFHGWFARLLSGAPLQSGVTGRSLDEGAASLLDEAWAQLGSDCARAPEGAVAQALLWLYGEFGADNVRTLLRRFIDRRAEWRVWCAACGGVEAALAELDAQFGMGTDPLADCRAEPRLAELEEFARLLGQNTDGDQKLGNALAQAVVDLRSGADLAAPACFASLTAAFLTKTGAPRARKPSGAQAKRLGGGEARFLSLHAEWSARLQEALDALQDQRNAQLNRQALCVGEALLAKLDELKRARRVMDFGDLEAEIDALLATEGTAAWLQARLDAKYRHILLDEFQDTNPLQWRILRAWLDGYAGTGAARPSVFLVGDPKQSIYRFRRAEPKLFAAAAEYFRREFDAEYVNNAHTFRNAAGIVALVNAVFEGRPGFAPQTTEQTTRAARVEILPLIAALAEEAQIVEDGARRQPLREARVDPEDQRRAEEAALLATRIGEMVGRWQVGEGEHAHAARYADILILTRAKTHLATYEAALRAAGIPFVSPGQGGLLATLEAQDLLALLRFLADPADKLRLAHALRTPALGLSDDDLLALSAGEGAWWPALQGAAAAGTAPAHWCRAATLLAGWLEASAHLPAHDLIDRIFAESDWFARTRAAVPAALWPGVHANLEALLELALNVDAGRYPSLTRFVDELSRLSSADEEAPDEGLVAAAGEGDASGGRVRIMTIHGAKGLEAPIVWLIGANAQTRRGEGYGVALDWPVESSAPAHFSLLARLGDVGKCRRSLLEAEKEAAEREDLNLLYVAITRAEQVFIASGIEAKRASGLSPWALLAPCVPEGVCGALPELTPALPADSALAAAAQALPAVPAVGRRRPLAPAVAESAGMVFGTALHAWLEAHANGWPQPEVPEAVAAAARRVLARPALQRFFDPACFLRAGSETEYLSASGRRGRIDRWVECEDAVWVLDYKSGQVPEAALLDEYRSQLGGYCEALRAVFPGRAVRALLVFTEGGELETVVA